VYWQVVLLGIAVAVAMAILGLAVFMPPAPPAPPQLYVEVKPSGDSYLLYVKDSDKALREVWYSKNGGPLLEANGPIRAVCGDRIELVAVYEDGSRQSTTAVVKCTKPLKVGLSQVQTSLVTWSASSKLLDVVSETDPDAVGIKAYLSYCDPPYVEVTLIAETRYGSQQLPYKAYLRLHGPYSTTGPRWVTTFGTFPITVRVGEYLDAYTPGGVTLNGIYSPRNYINLTVLHLPSFSTLSDYIAGSPITIGFFYYTDGNVYIDIGGERVHVGYCRGYTETRQKPMRELAPLNVTVALRYHYAVEGSDRVYAAELLVYKKPDGGYVVEAYHGPTPYSYSSLPDEVKKYWERISTRYGEVRTDFIPILAAIVSPGNLSKGLRELIYEWLGRDSNSTAAKEVWNFIEWIDSLSDEERGLLARAMLAGALANAEDIVEDRYGGNPVTLINRNVEYTVRVVEASSRTATVRIGSVAVPGLFLGLLQGSTPFIVPDYVAILLANYTSIPAVASYR